MSANKSTDATSTKSAAKKIPSGEGAAKWGPSYDGDTSSFQNSTNDGKESFLMDEMFDYLKGCIGGTHVYPVRLRPIDPCDAAQRKKATKQNKGWRKRSKAYRLEQSGEDLVMMHKTQPSHSQDVEGHHTTKFVWKIIPDRSRLLPLVTMVRVRACSFDNIVCNVFNTTKFYCIMNVERICIKPRTLKWPGISR